MSRVPQAARAAKYTNENTSALLRDVFAAPNLISDYFLAQTGLDYPLPELEGLALIVALREITHAADVLEIMSASRDLGSTPYGRALADLAVRLRAMHEIVDTMAETFDAEKKGAA